MPFSKNVTKFLSKDLSKAYNPLYANVALGCVTFYLCLVLTWDVIGICRRNRSAGRISESNKKFVFWMRWLCLLASYSLLFNIVFASVRKAMLYPNIFLCRFVYVCNVISLPMPNFFAYAVLFIKQHLLYKSEPIKQIIKWKNISKLGAVSYGIYVIVSIVLIVLQYTLIDIGFRGKICAVLSKRVNIGILRLLRFSSILVAQIGLGISLLIPFIMYRIKKSSVPRNRIMRKLYKSSAIAFVCISTDVAMFGCSFIGEPTLVGNLIATSYLVNCVCIVLLFNDWKKKFFPMVRWARNEDDAIHSQATDQTKSTSQSA